MQRFYNRICEAVRNAEYSVKGQPPAVDVFSQELFEFRIRVAIAYDFHFIGKAAGQAAVFKHSIPQFSMINKAWLDDLGLEVPTTLDELHTALKAFKDNDMSAKYYGNSPGSTIPMSTGFDE